MVVETRAPVRADGTPSDPKHPWNAKFVSAAVNRAANDSPELIAPAPASNGGAGATPDAPTKSKKADDQLSLF
jgi:hypothetical protein